VHGGLLYRRDLETHTKDATDHGIEPIDLVWINLYPFEATVEAGADFDNCVENIDIGGPAMLRAASKNADFVAVCTDGGTSTLRLRRWSRAAFPSTSAAVLPAKTYARTAAYDAAISEWYWKQLDEEAGDWRAFGGKLQQTLRYGENPHQKAVVYAGPVKRAGVLTARQVQGKELQLQRYQRHAMRLTSSSPSSMRKCRPPSPSSSTPTHVVSPPARLLTEAYRARAGLRYGHRPSAASSRSTCRSMVRRRRRSPKFSPKS